MRRKRESFENHFRLVWLLYVWSKNQNICQTKQIAFHRFIDKNGIVGIDSICLCKLLYYSILSSPLFDMIMRNETLQCQSDETEFE